MRLDRLSVCAVGLMICVGCNEAVSIPEQTSAIDVVGDPADPVSEPAAPSDIVGFSVPSPDLGPETSDAVHVSANAAGTEDEPSSEADRAPRVSRGPNRGKTIPHPPARIGLKEPK